MAVHHTDVVIAALSELDRCDVSESEDGTVAFRADDHVLVVGHIFIASAVLEHIAECVVGLSSEGSCRRLEVLLCEHCGNVRRHEAVFRHLARIEPYAEGVVAASYVDLTDAGDSREARLDVDLQVVDDELTVE